MSAPDPIPPQAFTITAQPDTDLWRKPPSINVATFSRRSLASLPLTSFQSARVTFRADWIVQYDQGGLTLVLKESDGQEKRTDEDTKRKGTNDNWIKAGVEFFNSEPQISVVAAEPWADWSLRPVENTASRSVTVEMRREGEGAAKSLWIYYIIPGNPDGADGARGEKRIPIRKITRAAAAKEGTNVEVFAYAARPADGSKTDDKALDVLIEGWEVKNEEKA